MCIRDSVFSDGCRQRIQPHRAAGKFFNHRIQDQAVGLVQAVPVHLQKIEGKIGNFCRNPSVVFYLCEITHPLQKAVRQARRSPGTPGNLQGSLGLNLHIQHLS